MTQVETTDGVRLHVDDAGGDGLPVVLIHGWPLSGRSWAKQIQPLQDAGYRPITYDRRGFGDSDKPSRGFEYDTLAADLKAVLEGLGLEQAVLVGFSMGGGEVARYLSTYGSQGIAGAVFAAAIPPYMAHTEDNPDGPLTEDVAAEMKSGLESDRDAFFDSFTKDFFSANGEVTVDDQTRDVAIALARQSDQSAALGCMEAFGTTDFREDLKAIDVPTVFIHGDADGIVPLEGSALRAHRVVTGSDLYVVEGGPHGLLDSHTEVFNRPLIDFLDSLTAAD